jgi:hypothetical protein
MDYFGDDAAPVAAAKYSENLKAPVFSAISTHGPHAKVHASEWAKVMSGASSVCSARFHRATPPCQFGERS